MLKEKYPSTEDTRAILQNNLKAIREIRLSKFTLYKYNTGIRDL